MRSSKAPRSPQLEELLAVSRQDGSFQSEGSFTVAREKALQKLAEFQLPFDTAWVLKIIQSIVATGTKEPIRVELNSKDVRFHFLGPEWSFDEIENAFFQVELEKPRDLSHLVQGLWPVAIREKRVFSISLPGETESLLWDGERLSRVPLKRAPETASISVSHRALDSSSLNWVENMAQAGRVNSQLQKTITESCFVCPAPLTVDRVRIDSLQHCPEYGWALDTYPLALGMAENGLPSLSIPVGTFEKSWRRKLRSFDNRALFANGDGLREMGEAFFANLEPKEKASVLFLISFSMKLQGSIWKHSSKTSQLFWVRDGVVVDREQITQLPTPCSLGCYVNAEGLKTDITGLFLHSNSARKKRRDEAIRAILRELGNTSSVMQFDHAISKAAHKTKVVGTAVGLVGLGTATVTVVPGLIALGLGLASWIYAGAATSSKSKSLADMVEDLRVQLAREL